MKHIKVTVVYRIENEGAEAALIAAATLSMMADGFEGSRPGIPTLEESLVELSSSLKFPEALTPYALWDCYDIADADATTLAEPFVEGQAI